VTSPTPPPGGPLLQRMRVAIRMREFTFGTFSLARGLTYLSGAPLPHAVQVISIVIPVNVWAWLWMASACCMYLSVIRYQPWATYPAIGLSLVWAVGYSFSGLLNLGDQTPWLAAITYVLWTMAITAGTVIVAIALRLYRALYPPGNRVP
jgi:hypothetical protein